MSKYRHRLPQLKDAGRVFLADGGLETTLIYHDGIELPYFAAFDLLKTHLTEHHLMPPTAQEMKAPGIAKTRS